jgi:hypothetical protein
MKTYRAVALYFDAELSEGFGSTKNEAISEARAQVGGMYPIEDVTFDTYEEAL